MDILSLGAVIYPTMGSRKKDAVYPTLQNHRLDNNILPLLLSLFLLFLQVSCGVRTLFGGLNQKDLEPLATLFILAVRCFRLK